MKAYLRHHEQFSIDFTELAIFNNLSLPPFLCRKKTLWKEETSHLFRGWGGWQKEEEHH